MKVLRAEGFFVSLEKLSDLYWCHPPQAGHRSGSDSWYWTAARELIRIQCLARGPFSRPWGGGLLDGEMLESRSSSSRTDSFIAARVECAVHSICFHGNVSWETVGPEFAAGRLFKKSFNTRVSAVRKNVYSMFWFVDAWRSVETMTNRGTEEEKLQVHDDEASYTELRWDLDPSAAYQQNTSTNESLWKHLYIWRSQVRRCDVMSAVCSRRCFHSNISSFSRSFDAFELGCRTFVNQIQRKLIYRLKHTVCIFAASFLIKRMKTKDFV